MVVARSGNENWKSEILKIPPSIHFGSMQEGNYNLKPSHSSVVHNRTSSELFETRPGPRLDSIYRSNSYADNSRWCVMHNRLKSWPIPGRRGCHCALKHEYWPCTSIRCTPHHLIMMHFSVSLALICATTTSVHAYSWYSNHSHVILVLIYL